MDLGRYSGIAKKYQIFALRERREAGADFGEIMYRVLIVDDEIPFLDSLAAFHWEEHGCRCIGKASNGEEAIRKCMQILPHIVITDINMPYMDGLSFLASLQKKIPEIQVILLTVHQSFDYARIAIQNGACDYVIKSMDYQEQLVKALEKAKKNFENHSVLPDSRYHFLYRGGRILVIESDEFMENNRKEIEDFFDKKYCTLASVYLSCKYKRISEIIEKIDFLPSIMELAAGVIIRGLSCVEFLTDYSTYELKKILLRKAKNKDDIISEKKNIITITKCGGGLKGYIHAHEINEGMYFRNFYEPLNHVNVSAEQQFPPLYSNTVFDWANSLKENVMHEAQLNQYIHRMADECKNNFYHPKEVKKAFDSVLYKYEATYSIGSHDELHKEIMESENIIDLEKKMITVILRIQNQSNSYSYIVNASLEYIGKNFGNADLKLLEVAQHVGMSPGYLSKKIKEETGKNFQQILIGYRMEAAYALLKNSDKKIYEVAERVGYENYRSFVNTFSSYFGVNPKRVNKRS